MSIHYNMLDNVTYYQGKKAAERGKESENLQF